MVLSNFNAGLFWIMNFLRGSSFWMVKGELFFLLDGKQDLNVFDLLGMSENFTIVNQWRIASINFGVWNFAIQQLFSNVQILRRSEGLVFLIRIYFHRYITVSKQDR